MKISFSHLANLISNLRQFGDIETPQTPMEYAAHKLNKQWPDILKRYQDALLDIDQDLTAIDPTTMRPILDEKGNYLFTQEGHKARTKAIRALNEEEVEITIYHCKHPNLVNALPLHLKELYNGVLFEWDEASFEASFEPQKEIKLEECLVPVALNGKDST